MVAANAFVYCSLVVENSVCKHTTSGSNPDSGRYNFLYFFFPNVCFVLFFFVYDFKPEYFKSIFRVYLSVCHASLTLFTLNISTNNKDRRDTSICTRILLEISELYLIGIWSNIPYATHHYSKGNDDAGSINRSTGTLSVYDKNHRVIFLRITFTFLLLSFNVLS